MPGGEIPDHGHYTHNEGGSDEWSLTWTRIDDTPDSSLKITRTRRGQRLRTSRAISCLTELIGVLRLYPRPARSTFVLAMRYLSRSGISINPLTAYPTKFKQPCLQPMGGNWDVTCCRARTGGAFLQAVPKGPPNGKKRNHFAGYMST